MPNIGTLSLRVNPSVRTKVSWNLLFFFRFEFGGMVSVPQFFSCPHDHRLQEQINSYTPVIAYKEPLCLLLGPEKRFEFKSLCLIRKFTRNLIFCSASPPSSGKTSLLFQYAYNYAASTDLLNAVYFICSKQKISNQLPRLPPNFEPRSEVMQRIKMK